MTRGERTAAARRWSRLSDQRGQSLVELALLMPVCLLLVMGTVEMSRAMYAYITIVSASTVGAQFASSGNSASLDTLGIGDAVRQEAISLNPAPTTYIFGPSSDGVEDGMGQTFQKVTVQVNYSLQMMFPWPVLPSSVPMKAASTMRVVPRP